MFGPSVPPSASGGVYTTLFQSYPKSAPNPEVRLSRSSGGSDWSTPSQIVIPPGGPIGDPFVAWDKSAQRFRFVVLQTAVGQVWFGTIDSSGSVSVGSSPVMAAVSGYYWDYPSVAVRGNGIIAVGAQLIPVSASAQPTDHRFLVSVSNDGGGTFSSPVEPNTIDHIWGVCRATVAARGHGQRIPPVRTGVTSTVFVYRPDNHWNQRFGQIGQTKAAYGFPPHASSGLAAEMHWGRLDARKLLSPLATGRFNHEPAPKFSPRRGVKLTGGGAVNKYHPPYQTSGSFLIEHLPYRIEWHKSVDGHAWTSGTGLPDKSIMWFWTPRDKTTATFGGAPAFTPPLLDARAGENRWVVSFPVDYYGRNNIATCNSELTPSPCALLDADATRDQFLQGSSTASAFGDPAGRQDYWHSLYTIHTTQPALLMKKIYYQPPGGGWPPVGYVLQTGSAPTDPILSVDPQQWRPRIDKCAGPQHGTTTPCWDGGDYGQIASNRNAYAAAMFHSPELRAALVWDPPGEPQFRPNTISLPMGADLRKLFPESKTFRTGGLSPTAVAAAKAVTRDR